MKILLDVTMPHEPFNTYVRDGTAGQKIGRIIDELKPEAIYFTEKDGGRGCVMIVELSDPSGVPALAEPFFLTFNARLGFRVCMSPADLQKAGLDDLGKKWG
ncbi:MAG: panthothenate synthetase [Verrucomicrobia bacterium]|nr:panthothenate synthetase [Verrucomicrobiota bacterium]